MILFEFDFKGTTWLAGQGDLIKAKNLDLVLSVIANGMIRHGVDDNGYVDIPYETFKGVYTGYKIYLDFLHSMGMITKSPYNPGKKCFGYRFSEGFKRELKISNIILDYKTKGVSVVEAKKQSKTNIQKCTEQNYIDTDLFEHLLYDFKNCTIEFDLSKRQLEKTKDEWNRFIDIQKWFINNLNLYRWKKGFLTFGFQSNRLYSNFVYLSGHVRKNNIKLNNERIVEFDIHNSFPIMLAVYCLRVNPEISSDYEFKKYCSNVVDGKFYDELTKGLNNIRNCDKPGDCEKEGMKEEEDKKAHRKFLSRRYISRLEVKKVYQIYLNGNNNRTSFVDGESVFINDYMKFNYPVIHEIITGLKNECEKEMKKKVVYTKLVDIETTFIFNVIKDLYERYDGISIITCHDAIYVPESFQECVQTVWDENLEELIKELPYDASMNDEYEELSFASLGEEMFGEYLDNEDTLELCDDEEDDDEDEDW